MNRHLTAAMAVLLTFVSGRVPAAIFYVAPNGNDAWSGTLSQPNATVSDGPFATVVRARDAVRSLKMRGPVKGPVTIFLREGVYRIPSAVEFTPDDSGTEATPITYAAMKGEHPVLSGGRLIAGWRKGEGQIWTVAVPGVKEGQWYFHQLFVNGQRRTRARTPNRGYLYTEGILAPFDRAKWYEADIPAKRGFYFRPGDLRGLDQYPDALIVIYHSWTTSIHRVTQFDPQRRIVKLAPPSAWPIGYWWEYNTRYHLENVPEALDEPGEWYLERKTGLLSYWPMPDEDMTKAEVVAPVVRQTLVSFKGEPAAKRYIEYLRFQGISFQHADCYLAADMPLDEQGATERLPMIAAQGLRHAVFEDCELAHAGENGLWLDSGCCDNVLRRVGIHDLGGGAVFIGPKRPQGTPETAVQRNVVDNCFLYDGSHIFRGSQGVWIGTSSYNQVTHNEICGFHHLGISVGHSWGYAPSTAHHNVVAWNHVHHICNGYFSDGGGIYTLGISPGTVVRNNVVHDVLPTPLMPVGGCGIYHDEGSSGILVENNVVYDVGAAAFTQHYGKENLARNNIFAFGGRDPICCARPEEHLSYTFEGNIVLSNFGQATSDHFSPLKCKTEFKRNLYWDLSGKEPLFSGVSFAEWQKTGRDRDSRIADPQFLDVQRRDFRLRPTSPALAMGFKPIAIDQAGLYGDADWVTAPLKLRWESPPKLPAPPPPPPPRPLLMDFESDAVGALPVGLNCSPGDRLDALQVTGETAAGGKRSLKFIKTDGLKYGFQPHVFLSSNRYASGRVRFACEILNSARHPAECYVGLRDYTDKKREYLEGPSIQLQADGTLVASGKPLTKMPLGKWLHLEIQVDLGQPGQPAPAKSYRLLVAAAGQRPQVFEAVPYLHPEFSQLTWFGFSSGGKLGSVFYVDDVRLEPVD
jgi:hypothetical protein